jgi:MFS family permease
LSLAPRADNSPAAATTGAFHGWWIVLVGAVGQAFGPGMLAVYGFVASPIVAEFGASDTQVGIGMSLAILGMAIASPLVGPFLDRGPIRAIMLGGVALAFTSLMALAQATSLWQLGVGFVVASIGLSLYGPLPVQVLLIRWFIERRGLALALAGIGYSAGSLAFPPATAWLVTHYGWRAAVQVIAATAAAVTLPIIAALVVARPEDRGQIPDGRPATRAPGEDMRASTRDVPLAEITRNRNFWLIGLGTGLALGVSTATFFLVRHVETLGISAEEAAMVYIVMGLAGMAGKLISGTLSDGFDERLVTLAALACLILGWASFTQVTTLSGVMLAGVPAGLGAGGMIPMPAVLIGACFGRAVAGKVMGLQAAIGLPFLLSISPLVGVLRDRSGSFQQSFLALVSLLLVAVVLILLLRIPRSENG